MVSDGVVKQRKISEPMVTDSIAPITTVPQTLTPINLTNGGGAAAATTTTNPPQPGIVPPDLTTMSDHDLIRYINPSCFDQGNTKKNHQ